MQIFAPTMSKLTPRPYQQAALDALNAHLAEKSTNPCVVIPTGGGKSPIMAWALADWKREHPPFRAIVLAHVKELVRQNAEKMLAVWPEAPIGIYSAGLGRKDRGADILFAGIDSVAGRAPDFDPFDVVLVDEAHRIPPAGDGKYRKFIAEARLQNPALRVVGFTATPYRLGVGPICHPDHILHEIAYEANVRELIDDGYLCPLRSKVGQTEADLSNVHKRGGEYIAGELAEAVNKAEIVEAAVAEAVKMIAAGNRQAALWFCVDVDHCHAVAAELRKHGIEAPVVTGNTPAAQRDRIARDFIDGRVHHVCNVNVYTEGFDATRCDCVVLLRPTKSKGLYAQMVGRGLRLDKRKADCLILDFAGCIDEHGPLDLLDAGQVKTIVCAECREVFSKAARLCPSCGWEAPKIEMEPTPSEERERRLHGTKAATRSIISAPEAFTPDTVRAVRHRKAGKPDSLRVTYWQGPSSFTEWVCLDHDGFAGTKAQAWWRRRFGDPVPTVDQALENMLLDAEILAVTKEITVEQVDGRDNITRHKLTTDRPVFND